MTLKFVIILQNLIKAHHRKSGKSKYDRKLTELDPVRCERGLSVSKYRPWAVYVWQKCIEMHYRGTHLVCGLFERHIGGLLPKKFPSENLPRYSLKRYTVTYATY